MILPALVRDCLYLNWALPSSSLPPPPPPLRYSRHPWEGGEVLFVSALLLRHERFQLPGFPKLRVAYPEFALRLCVLDGDDVPALLCRSLLVPGWVVPSVRMLASRPAQPGSFDYPQPSRQPGEEGWRWQVRRGGELRVAARPQASCPGHGPSLGSWQRTTRFFLRRERVYFETPGGLRRVEVMPPGGDLWPLRAEVEEGSLLDECLPVAAGWPPLHSAFLCPEAPLEAELDEVEERALGRQAAPVATDPAMFAAAPRRPGRVAA